MSEIKTLTANQAKELACASVRNAKIAVFDEIERYASIGYTKTKFFMNRNAQEKANSTYCAKEGCEELKALGYKVVVVPDNYVEVSWG